jgi:hypothetical protein
MTLSWFRKSSKLKEPRAGLLLHQHHLMVRQVSLALMLAIGKTCVVAPLSIRSVRVVVIVASWSMLSIRLMDQISLVAHVTCLELGDISGVTIRVMGHPLFVNNTLWNGKETQLTDLFNYDKKLMTVITHKR